MLQIFIALCFAAVSQLYAINGNATVSGFVYDKEDREGLAGATLAIKSLSLGVTTNANGYFAFARVLPGSYILTISYIGYKTQSVNITVSSDQELELDIRLDRINFQTQEIVITADSVRLSDKLFDAPASQVEMNSAQINAIPRVVEADLLRALQTIPGITALSDFSSALYVRGGTPDQNLFILDGTDVYNPEHAFGIFSTFNTNAIKKVELSKGGFGAEYGGRLSSVLDVTNLDGSRTRFQGVANISLLSASTTIQMPLGSIGSLSGSIRRTYLDQTFAKWSKDIPEYYFYDGNIKAFLDLNNANKVTISAFTGKDDLNFQLDKDKPSFGFIYNWGNTTGSINWRHIFSPKLFSNFWATYSGYSSNFNFEAVNFIEQNKIGDFSLKGALEYYADNNLGLRFGFEQKFVYGKLYQEWESGYADVSKRRTLTTAYFSGKYAPVPELSIETGLRYSYFASDADYQNFEPRFTAKYRLDQFSTLKFAAGRYAQYAARIPRLFFASIWTTSDEYTKDAHSNHYILGYTRELGDIYALDAEVYYKTYSNLYQFNPLVQAEGKPSRYLNGKPVYESTKDLFNRGDGNSYGFELMLKRETGPVTGWLGYSLSRTEYTFDKLASGAEFVPRHDRSHVINAVANINYTEAMAEWNDEALDPKKNRWVFGGNFVYATGQPITVPASAYYSAAMPDWEILGGTGFTSNGYYLFPGEINSFRLPAYIRLDLSVTYEIPYDGWTLSPYLQIFNIGNRKNVWFINYENETDKNGVNTQKITKVNMLPVLPSLGVTVKF